MEWAYALGQCRRTIAGLTARDKPVPTPVGLRGLRDQRPSAKLSDSLDPCRGLSTTPVSIHAPPWSSIPESAGIISNFRISKGQLTRATPMQSPPSSRAQLADIPRKSRRAPCCRPLAVPSGVRGRPPSVVVPHPTDTPGQPSFVIPLRVSPAATIRPLSRRHIAIFLRPRRQVAPNPPTFRANPAAPFAVVRLPSFGGAGLTAVARHRFRARQAMSHRHKPPD